MARSHSAQRKLGFTNTLLVSLFTLLPLAASFGTHGHHHRRDLNERQVNMTYPAPADPAAPAAPAGAFWLEGVEHQGISAFNPNPAEYKVFRNVKDYGAKGDGSTDDTEAINSAIQEGSRCGKGCDSSTITPALVYFPAGTYVVSKPIVAMYYSQLVGDATNRPVIKGSPSFEGMALVDSDPYESDGSNWYTNQNNFFRAVRNMVFDTTAMPLEAGTALHWQVAQASSLVNIHFELSKAEGNKHQGIFMDNGSGGFMSDLSFAGGNICAFFGNQQFMTRNMSFTGCQTAITVNWNWQWTFKSVHISGGKVGLDISTMNTNGSQNVGSVILLDSSITDTEVGLLTTRNETVSPATGGSALLDNVKLTNVGAAVADPAGTQILAGGTTTIDLWGQGHVYDKTGALSVAQGPLKRSFPKPTALLDASGAVFERSRPQYTDVPASKFISARSQGLKGDGATDDTAAMKKLFSSYGGSDSVIFFDHGVYIVSDTIVIPVGTRVVGEAWSVIMAAGTPFQDAANPAPVWQIGNSGDEGVVELSELLFQTRGPQPGAIMLQWNSRDPAGQQGANGMWDVHIRVAGTRGTELEVAQCIKNPNATVTTPDPKCEVAFMLLHVGKTASLYTENSWAWTSDHALDKPFDQISVYNARGIYVESEQGPVWMYAAASEHNQLYQYQLHSTSNVFLAMMQSETPYYQSNPGATSPFASLPAWNDPTYETCTTKTCAKSWGLRVIDSKQTLVYGAGFYSFFENYDQECIPGQTCQDSITDIQNSQISIYQLNTIAATSMIDYNGEKIVPASENNGTMARCVMMFDA
ncbi:pectate lyase superfamily protein-domain-containing protein [Geopyxis carbonaria]|nr:pectate lyase superfamily protein-domain-containing protein [Geopyxis carbonaria]